MIRWRSWSAIAAAFVAACALALAPTPAGAAASPGGELKALVGQVGSLPSGAARPLARRRLLSGPRRGALDNPTVPDTGDAWTIWRGTASNPAGGDTTDVTVRVYIVCAQP